MPKGAVVPNQDFIFILNWLGRIKEFLCFMFYNHMAEQKAWETNTTKQITTSSYENISKYSQNVRMLQKRFHETWELLTVILNTVIHLP